MAVSPMQLIRGLPYTLDKVQQNAYNSVNNIIVSPFLTGRQINNIVISAGTPVNVSTGLGKEYTMWFVVRNFANSIIWESTPPDSNTLTLNASANTTISVWVA